MWNNQKCQDKRIIQFDVMRIVAVFAFIWLHLSADKWLQFSPTLDWHVKTVYDSLVRWSVPIFIMISGALFLDANRPLNIKRLYTKNIFRILCAYFFWSCIYAVHSQLTIKTFIYDVINGPFHLWFLKTLLGLYIAIPLLKKITSDYKTEIYFLIVAGITTFILPFFEILVTKNLISNLILIKFFKAFNLQIALGYTGYFVLGHFLYTHSISKKIIKIFCYLAILSCICVALGTIIFCHYIQFADEFLFSYLNIFTLCESIAVFSFINEHFNHISLRARNLIIDLSNMSFGIYLVHVLVILKLNWYIGLTPSAFNIFLSVPVLTIIVFGISYLITKLISKIPYLQKYVI